MKMLVGVTPTIWPSDVWHRLGNVYAGSLLLHVAHGSTVQSGWSWLVETGLVVCTFGSAIWVSEPNAKPIAATQIANVTSSDL